MGLDGQAGVLGRALAVWGVSHCTIPKELSRVLCFGFCQSASTNLLCLLLDFVPKKTWRAKPETDAVDQPLSWFKSAAVLWKQQLSHIDLP